MSSLPTPDPEHRFVPRAMIADAAGRAPRVDAVRFRVDVDAVIDQAIPNRRARAPRD